MRHLFPALALTVVCSVGRIAAQDADVLGRLGITTSDANDHILATLTTGRVARTAAAAAFAAAPAGERAVLVRAGIRLARRYTATAEFVSRYAQAREDKRPQPPDLPRTGDEARAAQLATIERAIKEAQERSGDLPPDAREQLAHNVDYIRRQLAELNEDAEHRAAVDKAVREAADEADAEYRAKVREFQAQYPNDPNELIAQRLRSFLDLSATIDFSAAVVGRDDKKLHFVDPALEAKPAEWKMLYRAGKPAVEAARSAAQDWLKALGG